MSTTHQRKVTDQRYSSGLLSKTLFRKWIERATLKSLKGLAMKIPEEHNHVAKAPPALNDV
ncbi:hypothetical protein VP01_1268g8 [Puccinia sorghi]|uniref:Uncharacterized protein n=1 Tax=Puccinia sorghi TaxID=27349 RepID=A0A0L6VP15_9BASI|nr:hypothetical protein VP01_1268g8 [Puccinia sorghi]